MADTPEPIKTAAGENQPSAPLIQDVTTFSQSVDLIKKEATKVAAAAPPEAKNAEPEKSAWREAHQQEQAALEILRIRAEIDSFNQDMVGRRIYADRIFALIVWWLAAILTVLLLQGFSSKYDMCFLWFQTRFKFQLEQPVLLALIGGTTATVLGLFTIVANYLFARRADSKKDT